MDNIFVHPIYWLQYPIQYIVLGIVWVSKLSSNFGLGFVWDFFEGNKYCIKFVWVEKNLKILYQILVATVCWTNYCIVYCLVQYQMQYIVLGIVWIKYEIQYIAQQNL